MENKQRQGSAEHLDQLAAAELAEAREQLAQAGRMIEELRADALALAVRVDAARAEAEHFRTASGESEQKLRAELADARADNERLRTTTHELEAHVGRLKTQLSSPAKLVVKKAMRRGPYSKPDAS